jgi:hypothetical protein
MKEKITFENYALDTDTAVEKKNIGHSDYILNFEDYENRGVIKNTKGNTLYTFWLAGTTGENKCIGTCPDPQNNCVYYFVANKTDTSGLVYPIYTNQILKFDIDLNRIIPVLRQYIGKITLGTRWGIIGEEYDGSILDLNFDFDYKINNPKVIDGKLYWTDKKNPPGKINIQKAINFTNFIDSEGYFGTPVFERYDVNTLLPSPERDYYPQISGNPISKDSILYEISTSSISHSPADWTYRYVNLSEELDENISYTSIGFATDGLPISTLSYVLEKGRCHIFVTANSTYDKGDIYYYNGFTWEKKRNISATAGSLFINNWSTWYLQGSTSINIYMDNGIYVNWLNPPLVAAFDTFITAVNKIDIYSEISNETILVIKEPPTLPPKLAYYSELVNYNNLRGDLHQFAYRFKYDDYEPSVYSPLSEIPLPKGEEMIESAGGTSIIGYTKAINMNNIINIVVATGDINVTNIEIICKIGESGSWFTICNLDKKQLAIPDNSTYSYSFKNDMPRIEIAQEDALILFDNVPQIAEQQEIIDDGRLLFGCCTEGYDNVGLDVVMDYRNIQLSLSNNQYLINNNFNQFELDRWVSGSIKRTDNRDYYFIIDMPDKSLILREPTDPNDVNHTTPTTITIALEMGSPTSSTPSVHYPTLGASYILTHTITKPELQDTNYPSLMIDNIVTTLRSVGFDDTEVMKIHTFHGIPSNFFMEIDMFESTTQYYRYSYDLGFYSENYGNGHNRLKYNYKIGDNYKLIIRKERDGYYQGMARRYTTSWLYCVDNVIEYINYIVNNTYKSWKKNATRKFGLIYKDKYGRSGGVNTKDNMSLYIPDFIDTSSTIGTSIIPLNVNLQKGYIGNKLNYKSDIYWEINHPPPLWAYSYSWVVTKNESIGDYVIFRPTQAVAYSSQKLLIDFNSAITSNIAHNPKSILSGWVFQKGDRIRILGVYNPFISPSYTQTFLENYDFEIEGLGSSTVPLITDGFIIDFTGTWGWLNSANLIGTDGSGIEKASYYVMEVYRPIHETISSEEIYYEFGENYLIGKPGTSEAYHTKGRDGEKYPTGFDLAMDQDITGGTPATGYFPGSETYIRYRETDFPYDYLLIVEDVNFSDFYESNVHDYGKPYAVIPTMEQKTYGSLFRYSNKLIPNTQTNGLSTFPYNYFDNLPDKYGKITGLRQVEDTLKVIQEKKETSYYLSKATLHSANTDGADLVTSVTQVLGTRQISNEDWGCQNPESILKKDRHIYFWDGYSGAVIRDSANGMFPISAYGNNYLFNQISQQVKKLSYPEKIKIYSGFDEKKQLLLMTFIYENVDKEGFVDFTIAFEEQFIEGQGNRWKGYYSFIPEMYGSLGNTLLTFTNGNLYTQDTNSLRNNFFGVQYTSKIKIIGNQTPLVRIFHSIMLDSENTDWKSDLVTTPKTSQYPLGMLSKLIKFVTKEGRLYSAFLKDKYTPMKGTDNYKMVNGRDMRGRYIEVTLENTATTEVVLREVDINSIESKAGG